eukprot:1160106-Pelagomonas_calceolata.AAC.5
MAHICTRCTHSDSTALQRLSSLCQQHAHNNAPTLVRAAYLELVAGVALPLGVSWWAAPVGVEAARLVLWRAPGVPAAACMGQHEGTQATAWVTLTAWLGLRPAAVFQLGFLDWCMEGCLCLHSYKPLPET